jgi:hypothetical protein
VIPKRHKALLFQPSLTPETIKIEDANLWIKKYFIPTQLLSWDSKTSRLTKQIKLSSKLTQAPIKDLALIPKIRLKTQVSTNEKEKKVLNICGTSNKL